jgi:molybdopterin molybdotransferase
MGSSPFFNTAMPRGQSSSFLRQGCRTDTPTTPYSTMSSKGCKPLAQNLRGRLGLQVHRSIIAPMQAKERVLSFEEARRVVEQQAASLRPPRTETVDLDAGVGRVLAEPLFADRDFPPFPRAMRDGYALRSNDLASLPVRLRILGEIKAGGDASAFHVRAGEAVSIMTGAPAPAGADCVVMVEHTSSSGGIVEVTRGVVSGENIVPCSAEAHRGDRLVAPGTRIDEAVIAVAASVGKSRLFIYPRPKVAILSTGDEVVSVGETPGPNQIRNSNLHSLAAQVHRVGGEPVLLPIAPDEKVRLRALIEEGLTSDLLLLSGGVSVGRYDFVEQVLDELGAEFFFTGALIQPGRPVVFGRAQEKYFFGLPGNPVSTMVTFELFSRPVIEALSGAAPRPLRFLHAKLKAGITRKPGLKRFLPGTLSGELENAEVELARWQGSGDLASTVRANCYVVVAADREQFSAGEWVPVLPR